MALGSEDGTPRQRTIIGVSAVGFALVLVLLDSKHRHPETALQSVIASAVLLVALRVVLRRIADSRYWRVRVASATCPILVTIGLLIQPPRPWLLFGLTSAAVGAVMMLTIDAQNGLLKGLRRRDGP